MSVVIFLYVEAHICLKRLREREIHLFGAADPDFLECAGQYDQGTTPGRSLAKTPCMARKTTMSRHKTGRGHVGV